MNITLQDTVKDINKHLGDRWKCADSIQTLLNKKSIGRKVYNAFIRATDRYEVGFYTLSFLSRELYSLRLKDIYIDIPINKRIYVMGKSRFVKSFGIVLKGVGYLTAIDALAMITHYGEVISYNLSHVHFNVLLQEWGNLKEEKRREIDIFKENGLDRIMPEIMRRLAQARKNSIWEAMKWKKVLDAVVSVVEPELISEQL
jgi:hypothetical protein